MLVLAVSLLSAAYGCDRALQPRVGFYASADAIVVGKEAGGQLLVERVLRGDVAAGKVAVAVESVCGYPVSIPAKSTLIAMRKETDGSWTALEDYQVLAADEKFAAAEATIAELGDVGVRNVGGEAKTLRWRDWPFEAHTHLVLDVDGPAGPVTAKSNGIPDTERRNYFSQYGRTFEIELQPGQSHIFLVERVDSAPPGWGYKEDLDFAYYPMKAAGKYHLRPMMVFLADVPLPANEVVVAR